MKKTLDAQKFIGKTFFFVSLLDSHSVIPVKITDVISRNALKFTTELDLDVLKKELSLNEPSNVDWIIDQYELSSIQNIYADQRPDESINVFDNKEDAIALAYQNVESSIQEKEKEIERLNKNKKFIALLSQ